MEKYLWQTKYRVKLNKSTHSDEKNPTSIGKKKLYKIVYKQNKPELSTVFLWLKKTHQYT
jgi:hypothetical protein